MFWATASADEIVNRRKRKCYASTYDASTVINFILAPFFVQILCTCSVKVPMATYENPTCTRRGQSSRYQGNATKVNVGTYAWPRARSRGVGVKHPSTRSG